MTEWWIKISTIILFMSLFFAAFFSGVETAVMSASKLRLKYLAKNRNKNASIICELTRKPDRFLRVVLIGTNIAVIITATISSSLAIYFWGDKGVSISAVFTTLIILIFCEIIPKTIAQSSPEKISLNTAYYIKITSVLLSPLEIFFRWISNFIIRILTGKKYVPLNGFFTKKDIKLFFEVGEREGALEKKEKSMIEKILNLNETYVKNVMKPRENIVTISESASIKDAIKLMNREGLSRIPVYRDNSDNILGFIYAKDFLVINLEDKINKILKQSNLIHPSYFVSETTRVTTLLKEFQKRKIHIAVVIDKNKNISGVVTIEDLLEEIFGEIEDEFDKQEII
ncbi:MAG TPA: hypothetical protein DEG96_09035 [Candidatus Atribacteria bacterium]|nr:hypothetical protein [Candidatus Atribacteria bacterium]